MLRELRLRNVAVMLIDHDTKEGKISGFSTKTRPDDVVLHLEPLSSPDEGGCVVKLEFEKHVRTEASTP